MDHHRYAKHVSFSANSFNGARSRGIKERSGLLAIIFHALDSRERNPRILRGVALMTSDDDYSSPHFVNPRDRTATNLGQAYAIITLRSRRRIFHGSRIGCLIFHNQMKSKKRRRQKKKKRKEKKGKKEEERKREI